MSAATPGSERAGTRHKVNQRQVEYQYAVGRNTTILRSIVTQLIRDIDAPTVIPLHVQKSRREAGDKSAGQVVGYGRRLGIVVTDVGLVEDVAFRIGGRGYQSSAIGHPHRVAVEGAGAVGAIL